MIITYYHPDKANQVTLIKKELNLSVYTYISFQELIKDQLSHLKNIIVAVQIENKIVDLSTSINDKNQDYHLVTVYQKEGLDILRHTTTHVMAYAIKKKQPKIKITIGPVIENGFYYDIDEIDVKLNDFKSIENEMKKIIQSKFTIEKIELSHDDALTFFADNEYKIELINNIPFHEKITCYKMGEFTDLCRGPHLPNTGMIKAFKLTRLAGAYWRGDSKNKMLTRIYGTSFPNRIQLKEYIDRLEIAKKRDHNKLGREMGIFTSNELIGQGLPLLTPKGTTLKNTLQNFVEDEERKRGYEFTQTPYLSKKELFEKSGHWNHYQEGMFVIKGKDETFVLRPMTCPFHFCLYNSQRRSYRELPVRYAETSVLFRNESSGEMHGLIRIRQFTLSDGHIICTEEQIAKEFKNCLQLSEFYLKTFNLKNYWFRLSKWDPNDKNKYVDNPDAWESTQDKMRVILKNLDVKYIEADGEAAFYGPKLDLQIKNVYGKEDTLITIQIDFSLPEKFNMKYIDHQDKEQTPYVIHRGSLGCYERTMAYLIEEYEGKFPFWLAPEQVVILTINEEIHDYAVDLNQKLLDKNIRSRMDLRSESLNRKIREAQLSKTICIVTLGKQEKLNTTVSVRTLTGKITKGLPLDAFITTCLNMNQSKTFKNEFEQK